MSFIQISFIAPYPDLSTLGRDWIKKELIINNLSSLTPWRGSQNFTKLIFKWNPAWIEMSFWRLWKCDICLQNRLKNTGALTMHSTWKRLISTLRILSWYSSLDCKMRIQIIRVGRNEGCINSMDFRTHSFWWGYGRVALCSAWTTSSLGEGPHPSLPSLSPGVLAFLFSLLVTHCCVVPWECLGWDFGTIASL